MPHSFVGRLGGLVGRLGFILSRGRRRLTLENLARVFPELTRAERRTIARRCFRHWGRMSFEIVSLTRFSAAEIEGLFEVEGLEHLEAVRSQGSFLLTTGHYGAFEIASYCLGVLLGTIHVVVRPPNNPWIDRAASRIRQRTGNVVVPRAGAAHRMLNLLRNGAVLGIAIDQRVHPRQGTLVPFLDLPAWSSTVPAYLSAVSKTPTLPLIAEPVGRGRYRLTFHPPIFPVGTHPDQVFDLTKKLLRSVEESVRRRPEMWFWMHTRWLRCAVFRRPRRIAQLRAGANLPATVRFDQLNLGREAKRAILEWTHFDFLEAGENGLLECGDDDLRRLAGAALGHELLDRGHGMTHASAVELGQRLHELSEQGRLGEELRLLDRHDLVLLSDIDALEEGQADTEMILRLLEHRRGGRSTIATSRLLEEPPSGSRARLGGSPIDAFRNAAHIRLSDTIQNSFPDRIQSERH